MAKEDLKKVFCDTLIEMASADDRICLVNSDSRKYTATQDFDKAFPERSLTSASPRPTWSAWQPDLP